MASIQKLVNPIFYSLYLSVASNIELPFFAGVGYSTLIKIAHNITSDKLILSRPKMAPLLTLPWTQAKSTKGPFWTQLEWAILDTARMPREAILALQGSVS